MKTEELFAFDKNYSPQIIAGVDEAGRGPLAGPVVCACCIMPLDNMIDKINDSKKLSEAARETLFEIIMERAIDTSVVIIDHMTIDKINILNATKLGMKNAIDGLKTRADLVLVDAVKVDAKYKTEAIIKGDAKSYNIAAASILAKVTRDRIMREYDKLYPIYGFSQNKGYGTKTHIAALIENGKCPIHRDTFIKNFDIKKDR